MSDKNRLTPEEIGDAWGRAFPPRQPAPSAGTDSPAPRVPRTAAERLYRAYWQQRWNLYRQAVPRQWEQLDERERQCWDGVAIEAQARPAVASEGLRAALEAIEQLVGGYDHLGTGSYPADVLEQMERDAEAAWETVKRAALASDTGSVGALDPLRTALEAIEQRAAHEHSLTIYALAKEALQPLRDAERQGES